MLHGVDVHARYQAGLVASALPDVDFVITKATGGTSLVIDGWQRDLAAVKDQTVNTHGPDGKNDNLRDQLDRMEKAMTKGFNRMDHQFGEVHDRQQATDERALEEHHRLWDAIKSS